MGCIASSPSAADKANGESKRKSLGRGIFTEVSTNDLGTNCQAGHPMDKYDVLDTLGTGGFAVVKRVRSKMTGDNFAMKIINVSFDDVRTPSTNDAYADHPRRFPPLEQRRI
jgi:serine/threonine protein kinase